MMDTDIISAWCTGNKTNKPMNLHHLIILIFYSFSQEPTIMSSWPIPGSSTKCPGVSML